MAEPEVHTELTMFLDGFPLPLAKPDQDQASLDASIGDPTSNSTQGAANSGDAYPPSFNLLPQKGCVFQDPSAFLGNPLSAPSRAHISCFAHSHSVSAYTRKIQADCAGLSCPITLSNGTLTPCNAGHMDLQQVSPEYLTAACMASHEEGVHFSHEGQGDPTELHGDKEDCTSTYVKVNDLHASSSLVCTHSACGVTKFHDPSVLLSMESMNSCEESTSSHEEGRDSSSQEGSYDDFEYARRIRGGSADEYDGTQDPLVEVLDPSLQQADADVISSLQPCSSECSSAISMVSNATSEITSGLDRNHVNEDAMESSWTDAKHGSYLDYMETSFVKNLYGREYCASDVCGQQPSHQASRNLSPWRATLFEFKSWQSGDWHRRSMLKPPLLTCIPLALRPSPWVNHFRHRKLPCAKEIKIEDVCTYCGLDGEEEVDSPSIEVYRGDLGHDHTSRSNFEFAHDLDIPSRENTKKRRLESNLEQGQAMCR